MGTMTVSAEGFFCLQEGTSEKRSAEDADIVPPRGFHNSLEAFSARLRGDFPRDYPSR